LNLTIPAFDERRRGEMPKERMEGTVESVTLVGVKGFHSFIEVEVEGIAKPWKATIVYSLDDEEDSPQPGEDMTVTVDW
jgi:hypothetical protein